MAADEEHTTDASVEAIEPSEASDTEAMAQVLGLDPWMRFDVWATRAWEAADAAVSFAISNGQDHPEEALDGRVFALFHAAQVAKEFAEMLNPLRAVVGASGGRRISIPSDPHERAIVGLLQDDED